MANPSLVCVNGDYMTYENYLNAKEFYPVWKRWISETSYECGPQVTFYFGELKPTPIGPNDHLWWSVDRANIAPTPARVDIP